MAKKRNAKARHQNFKLTPHKHPKERVFVYTVVALAVGFIVGWLFKDQFVQVLGVSTY